MLHPQSYTINHLNLSWNSMQDENCTKEITQAFRKKFADFFRHSRTLQHLHLDGVSMSEETLEYVTKWGFRKSKTLLALHMSGNFTRHKLLSKFRTWLNVAKIARQVSREDFKDGNVNMTGAAGTDAKEAAATKKEIQMATANISSEMLKPMLTL